MNCHLCENKFAIRTDPKNCDYIVVSGLEKRVSITTQINYLLAGWFEPTPHRRWPAHPDPTTTFLAQGPTRFEPLLQAGERERRSP
jgi:hypothetical protein